MHYRINYMINFNYLIKFFFLIIKNFISFDFNYFQLVKKYKTIKK